MVIFGGLEVVAAGYLIHKHAQNKKERERLREAEELIEEEEDALRREARRRRREDAKLQQKIQNEQAWMAGQHKVQNEAQYSQQHQPYSQAPQQGWSQSYTQLPVYPGPPVEAKPERRRRSRSRERKSHRRHRRDDDDDRDRRSGRRREQSEPPTPTQFVAEPGIVTGWPSHWQQAHTPQPISTPPIILQPAANASSTHLRPHGKDRRGRSAEDLGLRVETDGRGSRTPSPRVRFNDGSRPGESRSPPPKYE